MEPPHDRLPADTQIGRVRLTVSDLDSVQSFYETVVGLHPRSAATDPPMALLGTPEATFLELVEDPAAPARKPSETGLFHTAFLVPSRSALGDALDRIRARGVLDGASDHLVSEALYLSDPEGNGIEVYRDRPASQWPRDPDGTAQIDTKPLDIDAVADHATGSSTVPAGTTVGHVHLEVADVTRSEQFYVDTVGMDCQDRYGREASFVSAGGYHHHLGLNQWNRRTDPPAGRGLAWYELVVPEDGFEPLRTRLEASEATIEALDDGFEANDPDGITFRVRRG